MRDERSSAPVFVKVDDYKEILDVLEMIKGKLEEIRGTLHEVSDLRNQEDSEVAMWNGAIDEIEKKVENIDKMIFEPGQSW